MVPNAYAAAETSGVGIPDVMLWRSTRFTMRKPHSGMTRNWHEQPMTKAILLSFIFLKSSISTSAPTAMPSANNYVAMATDTECVAECPHFMWA